MTKLVKVERLVLTQEMIDNYPHKNGPWCKLCSRKKALAGRMTFYGPCVTRFQWIPHFLKVGEKVVALHYSNGTVAYYCQQCFDDPKNTAKVNKLLNLKAETHIRSYR